MIVMSTRAATLIQSAICKTTSIARPAPSLFYFPGLVSKPVHSASDFKFYDILRQNIDVLRDEYTALRKISTSDYSMTSNEHKLHQGSWEWNSYILKGQEQMQFVETCPKTVSVLNQIPSLMRTTPFAYTFFSTLLPGTVIDPHFGPCNIRLRCHFPLIVPKAPEGSNTCGMKLGDREMQWKENEPLIFDDCYQHSVWNHTNETRVVLLFDIWYVAFTRCNMT